MARRSDTDRSILQTTVDPALLAFVTQQVQRRHTTTSQYLRDLIVAARLEQENTYDLGYRGEG